MPRLYIILIIWFVSGLLTFILMLIHDLRGQDYNECYFDDIFVVFGAAIILGCAGLVYVLYRLLFVKTNVKSRLYKLMYDAANIGIKTAEEDIND